MAIESADYISDLDPANPKGTDQRTTADDHARLIKKVIKQSFPNVSSEVSASAGVLNYMVGATSNVQSQINAEISNRAATSATLNTQIKSLSSNASQRINNASASLQANIDGLSATLNAAKVNTDETAYASLRWGGSIKIVGNTTASVSAELGVGDIGFVIP